MQLESQNEYHSFASMIITNMPYPPLPVVVLQSQDMFEGMASSHDLWQRAIISDYMNQTNKTTQEIQAQKTEVLNELMNELRSRLHTISPESVRSKKMTGDEVEQMYELFCKSFRTYFLKFYSHTSDDLRFFPMTHVAQSDKVVRQAQSHLKALSHLNTEPRNVVSDNYQDLIQEYAFELGDFADND